MKFIKNALENRKKWFNSELIFYIAVFCLPFENFFFAPSAGWAAISPVILALYIILNYKHAIKGLVKLRKILFFFIFAVVLGSITAFINNVGVIDFINSFVPLGLGAVSLLSFWTFYNKKKDLSIVINLIVIAYAICLMIGFIEYLTLKFNNIAMKEWLISIMKRDYLAEGRGRVQFFFTEPSFIGMHLFGILLPMYWLSRRKDLLFVLALFLFAAIFFNSGVRVFIDIIVVAAIYFAYLLIIHKKAKFIPLVLLILGLGFTYAYNNNVRIKKIVDTGIYSDGSLSARYFRMQSSVIGYSKAPVQTLFGFGMGNAIKPIHLGYDEARETYKSTYLREVDALDKDKTDFHDDSVAYSLYIRFISEYGLILTIVAIVYLIRITKDSRLPQRWLYFAVILYIYVQFESLGFYALWIFILTMIFTNKREITEKDLASRILDNVWKKVKHGKQS